MISQDSGNSSTGIFIYKRRGKDYNISIFPSTRPHLIVSKKKVLRKQKKRDSNEVLQLGEGEERDGGMERTE